MRCSLALILAILAVTAVPATAGDFRVETKIYRLHKKEEHLVGQNLTLFRSGVVYDFLSEPKVVTIFRPPADGAGGRFIVLDPARSVKMEVTTQQIEGLLGKLREWATQQEDPFLRFLAKPNFIEEASADGESLVLSSEYMTYRVRTAKPIDDDALASYRQFSDWYARFNTRGWMLPFPRLALNETLYRRQQVPTEVVLSIPAQNLEVKAVHSVTRLLSKQDRKMIDDALQQMGSFELEEFLNAAAERVTDARTSEKR